MGISYNSRQIFVLNNHLIACQQILNFYTIFLFLKHIKAFFFKLSFLNLSYNLIFYYFYYFKLGQEFDPHLWLVLSPLLDLYLWGQREKKKRKEFVLYSMWDSLLFFVFLCIEFISIFLFLYKDLLSFFWFFSYVIKSTSHFCCVYNYHDYFFNRTVGYNIYNIKRNIQKDN